MSKQDLPPTTDQIEIARWTASLGAVTAEALAHRTGVSVRSARGKLIAAERRKLLLRARPLAGRPSLFTVTRAGIRACDARGITICKVSNATANHLIECAATAAALERRYPGCRIAGEHELLRDEREWKRPFASAQLSAPQRGESGLHRPDLVLWPTASDDELPLAVEVELTLKARTRLLEICRAWARCRVVAGVIYFAPPHVERVLLRAVAEARAGEQVVVAPLESLLSVDTPLPLEIQASQEEPLSGGGARQEFSPTNRAKTGFSV
jgi:hypothetical protein